MGRVLARLEDKGLNIVAMKLMQVTPELARRHYTEHVNKPFYPNLEKFITSAPVLAIHYIDAPRPNPVAHHLGRPCATTAWSNVGDGV